MSVLDASPVEGMTRAEWLEVRRKGLGGSDAATILGLSPYCSPFQLWLEKTDQFDSPGPTEAMEWGLRLEDVIAEKFKEETGLALVRSPMVLSHPERPWMLASLDRWVIDDNGERVAIYEGKTASAFDDRWDFWGQVITIPEYVQLQAQHYLAVTGMPVCHGATLVGGSKFHSWRVERDERLIGDLITAEERWWNTYVVGNQAPPVDGHDATTEAIRAAFPESDGTEIDLPDEAGEIIRRWCSAKASVKSAKSDEEEAANQLRLLLGEAEVGRHNGLRAVTWKSHLRRDLDTERLRSEFPEAAAACTTTSTQRPLRLARGYTPND